MVISKPKRRSVNAGLVHFIIISIRSVKYLIHVIGQHCLLGSALIFSSRLQQFASASGNSNSHQVTRRSIVGRGDRSIARLSFSDDDGETSKQHGAGGGAIPALAYALANNRNRNKNLTLAKAEWNLGKILRCPRRVCQ